MAKHPRSTRPDGSWVELDERHSIRREGTGDLRKQWVHRFCGDWVASYPTKTAATREALKWEWARADRLSA